MSYTTWKVEYIPFEDNAWNPSNKQELINFRDPIIVQESGSGKDTFKLKLTNFNNEYSGEFRSNDKFMIYRVINTDTVSSSDVLMTGTVKSVPYDKDQKSNDIKLTGYNYSEALMDAIVFFKAVNKTPPEIIKQALQNAGAKNQNFQVFWHPGNDTAISDINYPVYTERFFNKTLREVVEKYSTSPKVGDNPDSYYYVDFNNYLVWRPKSKQSQGNFDSNIDEYKSMSKSVDTSGVKNYIILKGGNDPAGRQIQTKYINYSSLAKHGIKHKFIPSENNRAKNLINVDITKTYGKDNQSPDGYPLIDATAFTTAWEASHSYATSSHGIEVTAGNTVTINTGSQDDNKEAYVELIRTEIKESLYEEGRAFADSRKLGKLELELTFTAGKKSWTIGSLIECNIPEINFNNKPMRVQNITYSTDEDSFTLVEDEGTV